MLPSRIFFDNFLDDIDSKKFDKMMKCDIYEEDNMYHVLVEVTGFKKEDIKIECENGYLKVIAENSQEENEDKKYLRKERTSMTRCERSFYFGELNEDLIKAEFKDGILNISVPKDKSEEVVKKIINID